MKADPMPLEVMKISIKISHNSSELQTTQIMGILSSGKYFLFYVSFLGN